jgi:hypothetical protein
MRFGWIVSFIAHVLAAMLTLVTWPMAATRDLDRGAIVPVEIVTLADVTSVSPIASQEEEEIAVSDAAVPEAQPEPEPAPAPPQPRQHSLSDYLDEVQGSLFEDKSKTKAKSSPRRTEGPRGDRPRAAAGLGAAEQAALEDQLRALMRDHMRRNRCWRAPVDLDLSNPQRLIVTVRVRLDARGRVLGSPQLVSPATTFGLDPHMRAAADAAVRAILACDPYPFPNYAWAAEHYDVWRDMEFIFDPSQLSG